MKEQRHEARLGHQCETCGHDRPHHLSREWNGERFTVICHHCLRSAAKAKKPKHPPCSCLTRERKPCPNPGDRIGPSGKAYCHVHDPAGVCRKNHEAKRSKSRRVVRALENMRQAPKLRPAPNPVPPFEPTTGVHQCNTRN